MSLLDRAKRAARVAYEAVERDQGGLPSAEEQEIARLQAKLVDYERCLRHNAAYFELVESLCKQRDIWKDMWQKQTVENAAAQAYMNTQLEKASKLVSAVVSVLNAERKQAGRPLLVLEHKLDTGHTVRKAFEELIADLQASAPADIDGIAERDKLLAAHEEEKRAGGELRLESGRSDAPGGAYFPTGPTLGHGHGS